MLLYKYTLHIRRKPTTGYIRFWGLPLSHLSILLNTITALFAKASWVAKATWGVTTTRLNPYIFSYAHTFYYLPAE